MTLNRPRPPFSIPAPLYPDHLVSACHCILWSLDIRKGEKNKPKVLTKPRSRQMLERLKCVHFWNLACAWVASLSMLRNWHFHLAAFLQRNAHSILHTYSKQHSLAAMQKTTESRKRLFFKFLFVAVFHGEQLAWTGECGKLLFGLNYEISACFSPWWLVCGHLIVYLRSDHQSKCDPWGLLASLSHLSRLPCATEPCQQRCCSSSADLHLTNPNKSLSYVNAGWFDFDERNSVTFVQSVR